MNAEESSPQVEDSTSPREVQGIRRGALCGRALTFGSAFASFLLLAGGVGARLQAEALDARNLVHQDGAGTNAVAQIDPSPFNLEQAGVYRPGTEISDVQVAGSSAYAVGAGTGLQVLDVGTAAGILPIGGTGPTSWEVIGGLKAVRMNGPYAYVWTPYNHALKVLDARNSSSLLVLGDVFLNAYCRDVQVVGPYAYVAADYGGFYVFDVSDPTDLAGLSWMSPLGRFNAYGASAVQVAGTRAYVVDSSNLNLLDVSDPSKPVRLWPWSVFNALGSDRCLQVNASYAFVGTSSGIAVFDVRLPARGSMALSAFATKNRPRSIFLAGQYLFVAEGSAGLEVLGVADPTNLVRVAEYDTAGVATAIHVVGPHAYVADGTNGLVVLSLDARTNAPPAFLSQPKSQSVLAEQHTQLEVATLGSTPLAFQWWLNGTNALPGATNASLPLWDLAVTNAGDYTVVVSNALGVVTSAVATLTVPLPQITILTNPQSRSVYRGSNVAVTVAATGVPSLRGVGLTYEWMKDGTNLVDGDRIGGATTSVLRLTNAAPCDTGGYSVVAGNRFGVAVTSQVARVQVVPPAAFTELGRYDTDGLTVDLRVVGRYAYVADYANGLQVLDVSNPTNLVRVGGYDTSGYAGSLDVVGSRVYVADSGGEGLVVFDVSDPTNIRHLGAYYPGTVNGVAAVGNHAFVASQDTGFIVLDVGDPANIVRRGGYPLPGARRVHAVGSRAYVSRYDGSFDVLDVIDITNVVWLGGYRLPGSSVDFYVDGAYAYIGNETNGLQVLDLSRPTNIVRIAEYRPGDRVPAVWVQGPLAFVAAGTDGMHVLDVNDPAHIAALGRYANGAFVRAVHVVGCYAYLALYEAGVAVVRIDFPSLAPPAIELPAVSQDEFRFSFLSAPGTPYTLEYKSLLDDSTWTESARRLGTGQRLWITNSPASAGSGFYRLRVE